MRVAILGASSQIAKDLIRSFAAAGRTDILLYVRNFDATWAWVGSQNLGSVCSVHGYKTYGELPHDAVINCVGVGDPRRVAEVGSDIFEITSRFDGLVLAELKRNPTRRYIFLSSGASYGNVYAEPVTDGSQAVIPINDIRPQDYYAVAKLHAEVRHRASPELAIIDLRVFNIFSRTQNIEASFFISDVIRSIRDKRTLLTTADHMVRDFMHPSDFHRLVECLLAAPPANCAVDCYSAAPIDKASLLSAMSEHFGLRYEVVAEPIVAVNATGSKSSYYSLNRKAAEFGYQPTWSSLDCILVEAEALLHCMASTH